MGRTSSAVAILEVHGPTGCPGGQAAAAAFPGAQSDCLHELFERQADARGDSVALVCGDTALSYCELELRANRLAHRLRHIGAGPSFLVGVALARSELPIIAILGCLKAGAACGELSVRVMGGVAGAPSREELESLLCTAK